MITFSVQLLIYTSIFSYVLSDIADDVKSVCGGVKTCSAGSNNSFPNDSCCRPCECDTICLEKGTCCSDMEHISGKTGKVIKQACLPSIKYSTFAPGTSKTEMFYVRAKCPQNYMDQHTRNKCETGEPQSFEDIAFVSSKSGKIVYKNRHCAECNGENDVIPWKLVIDWFCIKEAFMSNYNVSSIADTLMRGCSLSFMRPNITQWKRVVCHEEKHLISSCLNVGSQDQPPDNYRKELQEICVKDQSALTFYAANNVYANVYCYLCNERSRVTCNSDIQDQKVMTSVYFLLDFTPFKENQHAVESKTGACDHQEFYDMYFETCRRIHCPIFEVLSDGRCASVVDSGSLNYGFNFVLVPEAANRMNQSDAEIRHAAEELSKSITPEIGLESCLICSISVKSTLNGHPKKSVAILYLQIVFTTSPYCQRELLLSIAAKLEDEEKAKKNLTAVIETLSFRIEYIPSDETFRNMSRNSKRVYTYKRCGFFNPSKFINCPKVTQTEVEYETVANLQAARSYQGFEVCLEDYKMFSNAERSDGKRTRISGYLLISFTILVVMCVPMLS